MICYINYDMASKLMILRSDPNELPDPLKAVKWESSSPWLVKSACESMQDQGKWKLDVLTWELIYRPGERQWLTSVERSSFTVPC
jgi:hypothetical protein